MRFSNSPSTNDTGSIVRVEGFATPDAPTGAQVEVTQISLRDPLTLK